MSARDLLQQRITLNNGDTKWQNSAIVEAALNGDLLILGNTITNIEFFSDLNKKLNHFTRWHPSSQRRHSYVTSSFNSRQRT